MNVTVPGLLSKLELVSGGDPIPILSSVVAVGLAYLFFYQGFIYKIGKNNAFWSTVRSVLPYIDDTAREYGFYSSYQISETEKVGTLKLSRDEAVDLFYEMGYIDNPIAAHKTDWNGRREVASLARYGRDGETIRSWPKLKRFLMMAIIIRKQLHVTLFEKENGDILVTAHYEDSPYNVFRAYQHFRGKSYNVEKGFDMVAEDLRDVETFVLGE